MSCWTYINGIVIVEPMGRTQAEKRYILETVLEHLPIVSGSERDMSVYILQKNYHNSMSSCDEFGQVTNNLVDRYGRKNRKRGWLETQDKYILVVDGSLRDRMFDQTYREFQKWLCRLAKRVMVNKVLVHIDDSWRKSLVLRTTDWDNAYYRMFETPTWRQKGEIGTREPNWCEYLMWERVKNSDYPMMLGYKYYADEENDAEVERRMRYKRGE